MPSSRGLWLALAGCLVVSALGAVGYVLYTDAARREAAVAFETASPVGESERAALRERAASIRATMAADDAMIRAWIESHDLSTLGSRPCPRAAAGGFHRIVLTTRETLAETEDMGFLPEGYAGHVRLTDVDEVLARPVLGRGRYDLTLSGLDVFEPADVMVILVDAQAEGHSITGTAFEGGFVEGHAIWFTASRSAPERRAICHAPIRAESSGSLFLDRGESADLAIQDDLRNRLYLATEEASFYAIE